MNIPPTGYDELKDFCMNDPLAAAEYIAHLRGVIECSNRLDEIAAEHGGSHE